MKLLAFLKKATCFVMIFAMIACLFTSCASTGKPLLMLDDCNISINLFELYLTRAKGVLCATQYGEAAKTEDFWETWIDIYDKKTYNTQHTEEVLNDAKTYLAAIAAFEELGLELPKSYIDEIDAELNEMVINEANGSKSAFNALLSHYGANYDILREAYIIDAKIAYLREELFGKNGSKVGANLIDDYYKENYARFKQVYLCTYEEIYEKDANGKPIGEPKIRHYKDSDPEMKIVESDAKVILGEAKSGDFDGFDELVKKYSEGSDDYPNGYYVSKYTAYDAIEVIDEVLEMQIGEVRRVRSDYGIHIVMRYELEDGAYTLEENDDLFISTKTGTYIFMSDLMDKLLYEYLEEYKTRITVDEELLKTVDIKSVDINYYY